VYLALNPVTVSAVAQRAENDWVVSATATVPVEYLPNSGAITLASFGGRKLIVYERLFWALQHVGWYHPYVGVYRWQFTASSILNELSNANADRQ
jgi:hypothetical protein